MPNTLFGTGLRFICTIIKKNRAMVGYQNVEHVKDKINIKLFARFTIPANQKSAWIVHQKCEKLLEKWGLKRVKCYKEMYTLEIFCFNCFDISIFTNYSFWRIPKGAPQNSCKCFFSTSTAKRLRNLWPTSFKRFICVSVHYYSGYDSMYYKQYFKGQGTSSIICKFDELEKLV